MAGLWFVAQSMGDLETGDNGFGLAATMSCLLGSPSPCGLSSTARGLQKRLAAQVEPGMGFNRTGEGKPLEPEKDISAGVVFLGCMEVTALQEPPPGMKSSGRTGR
jgi:hypothetical protein